MLRRLRILIGRGNRDAGQLAHREVAEEAEVEFARGLSRALLEVVRATARPWARLLITRRVSRVGGMMVGEALKAEVANRAEVPAEMRIPNTRGEQSSSVALRIRERWQNDDAYR